jgi:hypothetical protein
MHPLINEKGSALDGLLSRSLFALSKTFFDRLAPGD